MIAKVKDLLVGFIFGFFLSHQTAATTPNLIPALDICTLLNETLATKPLYISISYDDEKVTWTSTSEIVRLMKEFLDYCIDETTSFSGKRPPLDLKGLLERHVNGSLQQWTSCGSTNGTLKLLGKLERRDCKNYNRNHSMHPNELTHSSMSLYRFFLTAYLTASNSTVYTGMDRKELSVNYRILCKVQFQDIYCSSFLVNSRTFFNYARHTYINVWNYKSAAKTLTPYVIQKYTLLDMMNRTEYQIEYCDMRLSNSTSEEYINCLTFPKQDFRNDILFTYSRLFIGQNVAYWHSRYLGVVCHTVTDDKGPEGLPCPNIRLREREITWIKSLLSAAQGLASLTIALNLGLLSNILTSRQGQKENRLRPYLLNIASVGAAWGVIESFDFFMLLEGYVMLGDAQPYGSVKAATYNYSTSHEIFYHCCSDSMSAKVPVFCSRWASSKIRLVALSIATLFSTFTQQACCMFTLVAIGVIQVYTLLWPFNKPACLEKPRSIIVLLWILSVLVSFLVTAPQAAISIQEVFVHTTTSEYWQKVRAENENTSMLAHNSLAQTRFLTGRADGDSLLLQASSLCSIASSAALVVTDGLLALSLTVVVCYITYSSRRAVGVGKKNQTTGSNNGNAAQNRTPVVLSTIIIASGISCISTIPMFHYLLSSHQLADAAVSPYDAYSQTVVFGMARRYLGGRLCHLLLPFANPILIAVRYRPMLFPRTGGPLQSKKPTGAAATVATASRATSESSI